MNRNFEFQTMIYLIIFLALNFSCTNKEASNTETLNVEAEEIKLNSNNEVNAKLKYTSGIRSILHDSKGNYWFGSHQEGVCFFDGKSFTYFTVGDGLSDNQVRTIQEDENGTIWFGTGNGVSSYDGEKIINHTPKSSLIGIEQQIEGEWGIADNDLWFNAGNEAGVYRFDGQKLNYLAFPVQGVNDSFNSYGVTGFSKGEPGNLWIATYAAVFGFDGKSLKIIDDNSLDYFEETEKLHVRSILEDSKGNLWVGNNGIGVLLIKGDTTINFSKQHGLIHFLSPRRGDTSPAGTLEHVFVIEEDSYGNIWFGDRDTGAWKYDGKSMTNYTMDDGLPTHHIWEIYQDRNGDLLFAMDYGGVYKFKVNSFEKKY